jgi:xylulokinase
MMLMYGTTMFVVEVLTEARPHPRLWSTASLRPGTRNLAAGMATSGALGAWWREVVGEPPWEVLEAEAEAVPPGSEGLVVLPYFAGERAPLFDAHARGVLFGLTLTHGRGHIFRALLEGTAYGLRHNLETMEEAGGGGARLVAVGGGTQAQVWIQAVSDVTGRIQSMPAKTIGASFGDAFFGGVATGLIPPDAEWNTVASHVEPDPEATAAYEEPYRIYRALYPALREQLHRLAAVQEDSRPVLASPPAQPAGSRGLR